MMAVGMEAMAVYYLPGSEEPNLIAGPMERMNDLLEGESLRQGFVLAPFLISDKHPRFLIKAEHYLSGVGAVEKHLSQEVLELSYQTFNEVSNNNKQDFVSAVSTCVNTIKKNDTLSKVVLSRPKLYPLKSDFSPWNTLRELHQRMPNAFCFYVTIPGQGTWMGATPERLLEVSNGKGQTNALAGTLALGAEHSWSEKEIDEQQIVTDYIAGHLAEAKIKNITVTGPETISSGAVQHLKTVFDFEVENDKQLSELVESLHPTPAVCGMPKSVALGEISRLENYDRAYYTGNLGPLGMKGETRLFVNLRSMQLGENMACLYVGAGITEGSDPEKEWQETEVKAKTLLSVISE